MRFLALLKKELRECLPWAVSAAAFLLIIGSWAIIRGRYDTIDYQYPSFSHYSEVRFYLLTQCSLGGVGFLAFILSIGLGLAIGVRQFWVDDFTGIWGFTLHRSAARTTILAAKICAALISLIVATGLVWSYLYWRANLPDYSTVSLPRRWFIGGWIICGMGLLSYLGTGLAGLSKARWYTTKLMGLGFALWMFFTLTQQWTLWWQIGTLAIAVVILVSLIWETFLNREF